MDKTINCNSQAERQHPEGPNVNDDSPFLNEINAMGSQMLINHVKGQTIDSLKPSYSKGIDASTFDLLADETGFVTRDSLEKAAGRGRLDGGQRTDVLHMLNNFELVSQEFDDKDGGRNGISREDVARHNFRNEINHIESSTIDKLDKAADGTITKEALAEGLKRSDLTHYERDDMQYLQKRYASIKDLSPDGVNKDLGISLADIELNNAKVAHYSANMSIVGEVKFPEVRPGFGTGLHMY